MGNQRADFRMQSDYKEKSGIDKQFDRTKKMASYLNGGNRHKKKASDGNTPKKD